MAAGRFSIVLSLLAIWVVGFAQGCGKASTQPPSTQPTPSPAPAPVPSCLDIVWDMADCLSFVSNESTAKMPTAECCEGLEGVLEVNPDCPCEAFQHSTDYGISMEPSKFYALPGLCKISAPTIDNCKGESPGASPAPAPKPEPKPPVPLPPPAQGPVPACLDIAWDMADCLSFVSDGSTADKPTADCCTGLKSVLDRNPTCPCSAFQKSKDYGISMNSTKVYALPGLCKISAPTIDNCKLTNESSGASGGGSPPPPPPKPEPEPKPKPEPLPPPAQGPVLACLDIVWDMADCLSFVSDGSTADKPTADCCMGLKSVLDRNPTCPCSAFQNSKDYGISMNSTKVYALPGLCKISAAPTIDNCKLKDGSGDSSPAPTPKPSNASPTPEKKKAPVPASTSASSLLSVSAKSLVLGLAVALFSSF